MRPKLGQSDRLARVIIFGAFTLIAMGPARGETLLNGLTRLASGGVTLDVETLSDRVVFCVRADETHKVSSEFGVEFKIEKRNSGTWKERFPKVVTGSNWYFTLPLRIDLMTRGNASGQRVHVELGACSTSNMCDRVEFVAVVPRISKDDVVDCAKR